jgi:hypothetical protein
MVVVRVCRRLGRAVPGVVVVGLLAAGCIIDVPQDVSAEQFDDRGVIAGVSGQDARSPVLREPDGTRREYEALAPGWKVGIADLNNAGMVVGDRMGEPVTVVIRTPLTFRPRFPVAWDGSGRMTDLRPFLEGVLFDDIHMGGTAVDVNERGLVVGWSTYFENILFDGVEQQRLFVWDSQTGKAVPVPAEVGGERPVATAVNDAGVIVGRNAAGGARWVPEGGTYRYESLGSFMPDDINSRGDMVGIVGPSPFAGVPSVWLADAPGPTALRDAGAPINGSHDRARVTDAGVVVFLNGPGSLHRWRMATEVPEPFPAGWQVSSVSDVDAHGTVLATVVDPDGATRRVRWMMDH